MEVKMHEEVRRRKGSAIEGRSLFCSWSGGKDSCLSLYHAVQEGGLPKYLFTMLNEGGKISRSHGLPVSVIVKQAEGLNLPIVFNRSGWNEYEYRFSETLGDLKKKGVSHGVFGDIDLEPHREWCLRVCAGKDMVAFHPLWKRSRKELLEEFLDLGFKAIIVAIQADKLGREWLGKTIDKTMIKEFEDIGIDVCGESGEYHTVVTDGPLFNSEVVLEVNEATFHDGYWFLEISG
jgi:diphthine-ammonia ligase